jgi:PAS domain S-box-containing protein
MESTTRAHTETDSLIEEATSISRRFISVLEAPTATSDEAQQYRDLLQSLGVAIYTTDAAGVITFYNNAAAELWGREPEIGKDLWCGSWKIYHLDGAPMPHGECPMAICLKENRPVRGAEAIAERPDGSRFCFLPFPTPLRDESGRLAGAINVLVDITERKRAEAAALHLAAVVESSDDAIISKNLEGVVTSWNPAAERIFGYTAAEAIGQSVRLIIPSDRQHEEDMVLGRLRNGERIDHYETARRRKDGSLLDISVTISPVRDQTGRIIGASKVARDITDRNRAQTALRESEERFRAMANTIPSIVWTAAPDGEITYASDRWFEFTGITPEENRRGWPDLVLHPDDYDRCVEAWDRALSEGTEYEIEVRNRRHDGEYRWFLTRATPVRDESGRITAWYGTSSDITERKLAEDAAREAIEQSMALKDQFLGLVSHELRTPITTILGNALLLLRRNGNLAEDSKKQALRDVATEAERLQRIIENLLLLTRVDVAEQVETEPLRLQPLIAQAVEVFQRRNTRREISVTSDQDVPIVVGQAAFLALVLDNLITNADKYSAPDAPIEIVVRAGADDVEVAVRDHGIGLDEDDVDKVFSPFYRSSRGRNQAKGIGLGLAVCKRVMEAQGGSIHVVNRPEGGCDFIFTLRPYRTAGEHEDW